jgi:hypothetical protein
MKKRVLKWSELTKDQKDQVMSGDACGHPTNKPKNHIEAAKRLWIVNQDQNVVGWRE